MLAIEFNRLKIFEIKLGRVEIPNDIDFTEIPNAIDFFPIFFNWNKSVYC